MKNLKSSFKKAYPFVRNIVKTLFYVLRYFGWGLDDEKAEELIGMKDIIEDGMKDAGLI